jgi:hypothetical protein
VRLGHRGFRMLTIRIREGRGGVALRFLRGQPRPGELLCLQVRFSTTQRGLGGVEIRRRRTRRAGRLSGRDGLPRVAHLLHGCAGASGETDDTDKYCNEAQHRGLGH